MRNKIIQTLLSLGYIEDIKFNKQNSWCRRFYKDFSVCGVYTKEDLCFHNLINDTTSFSTEIMYDEISEHYKYELRQIKIKSLLK